MAASPVLSCTSEASGWGRREEGSSCTMTRCRQSTLESICSAPLKYPCLLLYLSYCTVLPLPLAKQETLLLGKARADGWRCGLAKLNYNTEEHGLQEVRVVNLIGQYGTRVGPAMKLSRG
jgi:hypothetical protein